MKTKTLSYTPILFCILILWSACKDDADAPLRFYDSKYDGPMGGRRYLGIESGNGDYSLEIGTFKIISHDWNEEAKRWRMRFKLV